MDSKSDRMHDTGSSSEENGEHKHEDDDAKPSPDDALDTKRPALARPAVGSSLLAVSDDDSDLDDQRTDSSGAKVNFSGLTQSIRQNTTPPRRSAAGGGGLSPDAGRGSTRKRPNLSASLGPQSSSRSRLMSGRSVTTGLSGESNNSARSEDAFGTSSRFGVFQRGFSRHASRLRMTGLSSNNRSSLFKTKFARRSMQSRFGAHQCSTVNEEDTKPDEEIQPSVQRRYQPGDYVLVSNHQSRWANLVNRYGFPPGEGETSEERRGPYIYVLAKVKQIHFEEIAAYYTVTRCDTGADQRADVDFMEPLRTTRGEQAAMRAATDTSADRDEHIGKSYAGERLDSDIASNKFLDCLENICFILLIPFIWLFDCMLYVGTGYLAPMWRRIVRFLKRQAHLFLYGQDPYVCRWRLTAVNFVVVCSIWFMFMDQVRLAFLPASSDTAMAIVNFVVWIVLVLELIFEVFIRPDGYRQLILSEKAYAPTTVRYINAFHLVTETFSLMIYIPEFLCILSSASCGKRYPFSFYNAALMAVTGPTRLDVFYGRAYMALIRLRVFGLVRHWRNMWITNTFINMKWKSNQGGLKTMIIPSRGSRVFQERKSLEKEPVDSVAREQNSKDSSLTNASVIGTALMATNSYRALVILWTITGFFPVVFAMISTSRNNVAPEMTSQLQATNLVASDTSDATCSYLESSVSAWVTGVTDPKFSDDGSPFLLTLDLQPYRCQYNESSSITGLICDNINSLSEDEYAELQESVNVDTLCWYWSVPKNASAAEISEQTGIRIGSITLEEESQLGILTLISEDGATNTTVANYSVTAQFDQTETIALAAGASMLLQLSLLVMVLGGLSVLRRDAEILVLGPLRRMLRTVARYAKNPLAPPKVKRSPSYKRQHSSGDRFHDHDSDESSDDDDDRNIAAFGGRADGVELGSFETEQLITAVGKITDLLRKCWGVAGADIISTNLATQEGALSEVFNPTVPGQSVYALFGFAAINGFDHALRSLGGDVMILINDVAAVLHGEVFRWGFGDSGQCNKNLGSAFLMVFRIGLVKEVVKKLEHAKDVIFSSGGTSKASRVSAAVARRRGKQHRGTTSSAGSRSSTSSSGSLARVAIARSTAKKINSKVKRSVSVKAMSLSLQSLPGIRTFTDRAVIGMLKSFAGIHRDRKIRNWNNDFRLGAGVGAFEVSMIFGMDAGWAVEGAVGSQYKIDATYLSPHVNMASRMMSACKQYGVSIMLSQAVQELMSDIARSKLRHLDTVTVKGSSVKQKIYTYDARARGVDFFLYSRSEEQADIDADRYTPNTWNIDQDLNAMRQHVTDDFLEEFKEGHKAYIAGDWPTAIKRLERANDIMFETAFEEGYLEDEFEALQLHEDARDALEELKRDNGDGPSRYLVQFMKSYNGVAPESWDGWHPLMRK